MRDAGHAIEWDDPAHLLLLKAYHRSEPPALESAVEHLLSVVDAKPAGAAVDPALFQAAMRSCVKTKPARLDAALKLLDLLVTQGAPPNISTLTILLQCCRLSRPPDSARAEQLWRTYAKPPPPSAAGPRRRRPPRRTAVEERWHEACEELALAVGAEKADALISGRSTKTKSTMGV